jgi:hypothetical protein
LHGGGDAAKTATGGKPAGGDGRDNPAIDDDDATDPGIEGNST